MTENEAQKALEDHYTREEKWQDDRFEWLKDRCKADHPDKLRGYRHLRELGRSGTINTLWMDDRRWADATGLVKLSLEGERASLTGHIQHLLEEAFPRPIPSPELVAYIERGATGCGE